MAKKRPSKAQASQDEIVDFETAMADVERIVSDLEGGELDLTEALRRYEEGVGRLKRCHTILNEAERRVTLLSGFDADGNPVAEPMPGCESPVVEGGVKKHTLGRGGGPQSSMDDSQELF
jgi:exodeoxyribonuclease VII small subunit